MYTTSTKARIGDAVIEKPLILGHEVGAEVVAVGDGVTGLAHGDRVAVEPGDYCGKCDLCKRGLFNLCRSVKFFGTLPWMARFAITCPGLRICASRFRITCPWTRPL